MREPFQRDDATEAPGPVADVFTVRCDNERTLHGSFKFLDLRLRGTLHALLELRHSHKDLPERLNY